MSATETPPPSAPDPVSIEPKSGLAAKLTAPATQKLILPIVFLGLMALVPLVLDQSSPLLRDATLAATYVVMALGLNIIVGFAGLLDLGYVAFFAIGAYTMGWLGSGFFADINNGEGFSVLVSGFAASVPGLHVNFLIILVCALIATTIAGMIIGLPTLRLRGDYIAIVTLAFGEIIGDIAENGDRLSIGAYKLTNGKQGITPVDKIQIPGFDPFPLGAIDGRPWFWVALVLVALVLFVNFRLRDSRLGRAWIALREDEVAASSMGIPLVKTKLLAYGTGAAFGGMAGAFYGSYLQTINADQFQFSFSIFILSMVILGGLGSIWGVVVGAIALSFMNFRLIPELRDAPSLVGLDFELTDLSFGIFGFLLVLMMVMRPEGLLPERRRQIELTENLEGGDEPIQAVKS